MSLIFLLIFLISFHNSLSQTCLADPGCQVCNFYYFMINFTPYGYFQCDQCYSNYILNQTIGLCQCKRGYYVDSSNKECTSCGLLCLSCTDKSFCNQCVPSYNRILNNGNCVCAEGYQQINSELVCVKKSSALLIAMPSVGSVVFCILVSFIIYKIYKAKKTNGEIQIHDISASNNLHRANQQDVNIQMENNCSEMQTRNANLLWSWKQHLFKGEELCSICLDESPMYMTLCGHYFHSKCIFIWMQSHKNCPNCKQEIEQRNIRVWCLKCKNCLMPVVKQISISKKGGRGKREIRSLSPIQDQICNDCESSSRIITKEIFN